MIRRHGRSIRILMMLGDALVAMIVIAGISVLRFGPEWPGVWQGVVPFPPPDPAYAGVWVGLLALQGLYQSRAHWSIATEAQSVVYAAILLGLTTLATLFLLDADNVSRLVLLLVIPTQAAVTILARSMLRSVLRALRRRGRNLRHVLVVGTGPAAVDFADPPRGSLGPRLRRDGARR